MDAFIVEGMTTDGFPLAVCGLCETGQAEAYVQALSHVADVDFGSCRSEYAVDYRLAEILRDGLDHTLSPHIWAGASVAVPGTDSPSGGILGQGDSAVESAGHEVVIQPDRIMGSIPGRAAFCAMTAAAAVKTKLQAAFQQHIDGTRGGLFDFYEALCDSGTDFIFIADGSGPGSCGIVATRNDIVTLDEVRLLHQSRTSFVGLRRVGILGGAFDPVHNGHLLAAENAGEALHLDAVVFIPTGQTIYKSGTAVTRADWRCRMLMLAVAGNDRMSVSSYETDRREDISYTVDTVEHIRTLCDDDVELYFIAGTDVMKSICYWKGFDRLKQLCEFVFISRPGRSAGEMADDIALLTQAGVRFSVEELLHMDISSTHIRNLVYAGKSVKYLVPAEVERFIEEHRLYSRCSDSADSGEALLSRIRDLEHMPSVVMTPKRRLDILTHCLDYYYGNIMVTDKTGRMLYVNQIMLDMYHITREKALSMTVRELVTEGIIDHSAVQDAIDTRQVVLKRLNILDTNTDIDCVAKPIFDGQGHLEYVIAFSHDKVFMKQFEEQVRLEKQKRREIKNTFIYIQKSNLKNNRVICADSKMRSIYANMKRLAQVDSTILLYGESGVGKDVLASFIYDNSLRSDEVFMPVNCGAIPGELMESEFFGYEKGAFTGADSRGRKGIFEMCHKGTVFLDEIGEMPLALQIKLLRFLDSGEIKRVGSNDIVYADVRLIAATNKDLKKMVAAGTFREDLYYRLNIIPVYIPPLRERRDDIQALSEAFLKEYNRKYDSDVSFSDEELDRFFEYNWPGNIRELRSEIERYVITRGNTAAFNAVNMPVSHQDCSGTAMSADIASPRYTGTLREGREQFEKDFIRHVLADCQGNVQEAAHILGIHRSVLYGKISKWDLKHK